jgi:hypothetical protein
LLIGLLAVICPLLAVTTFTGVHNAVWSMIRGLLGLMMLNLLLCTIKRRSTLSWTVIMIHTGILITFTGGWISSTGFVATVNIYEGTAEDRVYRWDIEEDVSLGVDIMVNKLHEEYYPIPVKVGVLKGDEKHGLHILKTGESFDLDRYRVEVKTLYIGSKTLELGIFEDDNYIGRASTSGDSDLPPDFPFAFRLVAYADPSVKKTWLDLSLLKGPDVVAEGKTAVNHPLHWEGMNFYHTATNRDEKGIPFVGIQITRDPGIPYAYAGFCITALGGALYLLRRIRGTA